MINLKDKKSFVEKKVEGGKLVQIEVKYNENEILDVKLSGDFFIYPESEASTIEKSLENQPVDRTVEEFKEIINTKLDSKTELLGFNTETVSQLVKEAISDG